MSSHKSWLKNRSLFIRSSRPKPRKKRLVWHVLWNAFKRMLMLFGFMFLLSVVSAGIFVNFMLPATSPVSPLPDEFILSVTIQPEYVEYHNVRGLGFVPQPLTFRDLIDLLEVARDDERVRAVYASLRGAPSNLAQLQELRAAFAAFDEAGKQTYIYAPSLGGGGYGLGSYYLASAFDEIWMQPVGTVDITGIGLEVPFVRDTLRKIGVAPQFFARKDYKTIFESLNRASMSEPAREMYTAMLSDLADQMTGDIASSESREIEADEWQTLIDQGLFTDQEAAELALIDGIAGEVAVKNQISRDVTGASDKDVFVDLSAYRPPQDMQTKAGAAEAGEQAATTLVYVTGAIMSEQTPRPSGTEKPSAEDIAKAIISAARDETVGTLVLRIDSPGGAPVAAETILQALLVAKAEGKTVIVSMGGTAASGGYWVAAVADVIFAQPATITGSIGVAGGKLYADGLWDTLGVSWDRVEIHDHATMFSFNQPFSEEEAALVNSQMDRVYEAFIARVADGRSMSPEAVEAVAQGRVWTGRQAKEHGLVDRLGGLSAALDYAAREAGYESRFEMPLSIRPKPLSPVELLRELMSGGSLVTALTAATDAVSAVRDTYEQGRVMTSAPVLAYEPVRLAPR